MAPLTPCHSIDFGRRDLTIPIVTARGAVQSNEVYPPNDTAHSSHACPSADKRYSLGLSIMAIRALFFVPIVLLGVASATAWAEDWRPISKSDRAFDASRITRVSPSVLRVWERYVLIDEALDYARRKGLADEYRDYSYSIALRQLDCGKQTHGFVSIHNFNSRGAPTGPSTNVKDADIEMNPAAPGTNAEALITAVCDYSKRNLRKQ
jgi:hypothetical protein